MIEGERGWFSSCQHSCSYKYWHEIGLEKDPDFFGVETSTSLDNTPPKQGQTLAR